MVSTSKQQHFGYLTKQKEPYKNIISFLSDAWWMLPFKKFDAWFKPVLPSIVNVDKREAKKRPYAS